MMLVKNTYREAHQATDIAFNRVEGLVLALQDLAYEHTALGTSERSNTPINAIIDMLPDLIKDVEAGRAAEWKTQINPEEAE